MSKPVDMIIVMEVNIDTISDSSISDNKKGIWSVRLSFAGLFLTALIQLIVVILSGSVGLLADTIHNFGDSATAVPLFIAFTAAQSENTAKRFTFGFGRIEDFAGITVVLIILLSAIFACYESINRFFHPHNIVYLWAVAAASIIGFIGNEAVALFRINVGKEVGSAALIVDGYHARIDGIT